MTEREFPITLPGLPIQIEKQFDSTTGAIKFISHSNRVKTAADLFRLEANENAAMRAKHGVLDASLRERFDRLNDSEWVDVRVYIRYPEIVALDPETHTLTELEENERTMEPLNAG